MTEVVWRRLGFASVWSGALALGLWSPWALAQSPWGEDAPAASTPAVSGSTPAPPVAPAPAVAPAEPTCKKKVSKQVMSGGQVKTVQVDNKACLAAWDQHAAATEAYTEAYAAAALNYSVETAKSWAGGFSSPTLGRMALVPAGTTSIGCTNGQSACESDERLREVTISRNLLVMVYEVTQRQYQEVMGTNPSSSKTCGTDCPVENVSWLDAVTFANAVSVKDGLDPCYSIVGEVVSWPDGVACTGYRLPTEAEWEVAARGGRDVLYAGVADEASLSDVAWHSHNSRVSTHRVGEKRPNGYNLFDMSGNVYEWVWDWYGHESGGVDPTGPASGSRRVGRGGCWFYPAQLARVANRNDFPPDHRRSFLGFRLLRTAPWP